MTPVQMGTLYFTMATILITWMRGGHPERRGACALLVWSAASIAAPDGLHRISMGELLVFETAIELVLLAVFVRLALKADRWWPFAASAVTVLSVAVYLARAFVPELDRRAEISAHIGLLAALDLTLLAGVGERWLAGERPVSPTALWRRPSHTT